MTWTVSRNNSINAGTDIDRAKQTLCLVKDRLKACAVPWTVVGSGTGSGGSFSMAGVDLLPAFPSIVGVGDGAWICLQNAAALQIILQHDTGTGRLNFYFSANGGYQATVDASATLRPGNATPPAMEVACIPSTAQYKDYGGGAAHYKSVAVEDAGNGFICFGIVGTVAAFHLALYSVTTDPADTCPWLGINLGNAGADFSYVYSYLTASNVAGAVRSYHPAGSPASQTNYFFEEPNSGNTYFMTDMPPNPFSGKQQLIGVFAVCTTAGRRHVKGGLNGILRIPGQRGTGDTFEGGALVGMNDYAVPWGSAVTPLL